MKKKRVMKELRRRVVAKADQSEKINFELITSLQGKREPLTDADIMVEEHLAGGKEYVTCGSLSVESTERYFSQFQEGIEAGMQGQMTIKREPMIKGRLLGKENPGRQAFIAALAMVGSGISAFDMDGDQVKIITLERDSEIPRTHIRNTEDGKAIVLDLARILDEAVARVSFFRHQELDRYPPMLLTTNEAKKNSSILKARLGMISRAETASENQKALANIKKGLGQFYAKMVGTDRAVSNLYMGVKFEDMVVKSAFAEDDIQHTIALCNLIARSSMISAAAACSVSGNMRRKRLSSIGYTEDWQQEAVAGVIGKLAEIAYGSPFLRLSDVNRRLIVEGPDSKENLFQAMALPPLLSKLFKAEVERTGDMALSFMYGTTEAEWREAAAPILEEMGKEIGFSFHAMPGILDTMERINRMDFVTRENLPVIAGVMSEIYQ